MSNTWAPNPQQLAQMQTNLADAWAKRHLLMTGRLSVEVEVEGRMVRYSHTTIEQLDAYIADLERWVNGCRPRYGAIGVVF